MFTRSTPTLRVFGATGRPLRTAEPLLVGAKLVELMRGLASGVRESDRRGWRGEAGRSDEPGLLLETMFATNGTSASLLGTSALL